MVSAAGRRLDPQALRSLVQRTGGNPLFVQRLLDSGLGDGVGDQPMPNDIAQLKGRRFVAAAETDTGRRFSEGIIKQLTGSDTISARFMRGEFFEFSPICKLWLSTNHKPVIRGTDEGIWRRIRLIPFEQTFPPEARDPELPADLAKELSGIFTWMVRGCSLWLEKGLEAYEGKALVKAGPQK